MKSAMEKITAYACVVVCAVVMFVVPAPTQPQHSVATNPASTPRGFSTPDEAAAELIRAATSYDQRLLLEIVGSEGKDLISSADPVRDKNNAAAFAAKADEKQLITIDPKNSNRAVLSVGVDKWPLPIPLVRSNGKWFFDVKAGRKEILLRRIGANELDAIQVCRGYVEAQHEYAAEIHDESGIHQYAQRIISTPEKKDGLYWVTADGEPGGPISEGIARAIQEGYTTDKGPYHGYYFKILKGQGPAAPLGRLDYVIQGVMIGGFALVAVPAEYRVTGVQTFVVGQDGIVYQKDLGPNSLASVKAMELYDPDKTWRRTNDEWPVAASTKAPTASSAIKH